MTDAEKIARIVEWMGRWPDHIYLHGFWCIRDDWSTGNACKKWNPFERIDDAFLLKDRMMGEFKISEEFLDALHDMAPNNNVLKWLFQIQEPARAIAEAAWQVISRLDPDRGSG